jgi:hypothetical protein
MLNRIFNWRILFIAVFILIAVLTILFAQYLAKKIAKDELQKVSNYITALDQAEPNALSIQVLVANKDIPIILTTMQDSIIETKNLDTAKLNDPKYLLSKINQFKKENPNYFKLYYNDGKEFNKLYFGHTDTFKQIKYFPYILVAIVSFFLFFLLSTIRTQYKSTQSQLWTGMAKETAHQLGTPISSLQAWLALAQENDGQVKEYLPDMLNDVERLKLVSERFGKIGSQPKLMEHNIYEHIQRIVTYMQKRASGQVVFNLEANSTADNALISPELFDWVIENLIKNALDSIAGKGTIQVVITNTTDKNTIDIKDSGKGIERRHWETIFKPGYTTKKRGWGLGLTLCKRIIEEYHKGRIFVKHSAVGQGTTFSIVLMK